jgi:error-prone DNA polymerase
MCWCDLWTVEMHYAELHCKTNFSFLEGASHPEELVARAAELGYAALAITDRNSLAGVVRAHVAAKALSPALSQREREQNGAVPFSSGLKLLIGAEITPVDASPVVLWATDRAGYGRLSRLITLGRRRAAKGECKLTLQDVATHAEGLVAGVVNSGEWRVASGEYSVLSTEQPVAGPLTTHHSLLTTHHSPLRHYRDIFADRCYLLAELHRGPNDERRLEELIVLSRETGIPLVAAGDVHYHVPERMALQHVLTAVRHGLTVAQCGERLLPNAERHLRPLEEIAARFVQAPQLVSRTLEVAERCQFSLDELRYDYPHELAPQGQTPMEYLERLTWQGAAECFPRGVPDKVRGLLEHELALIRELRYEAYFLTVWDLVRFARSRGILCQGRGSAANSAVCYCLGITSVDPSRMDVLFERFVSRERQEAPDIDVDFEHERREEVLQYLYDKYGRERAGIAAEVITYRARSAIRDVGKALGLSLDRVDALAKQVEGNERAGDRGQESGDRDQGAEESSRTSNIEHRTSNIEHRTSNIEHRTSNIEHRTLNIEREDSNCWTLDVGRSMFDVQSGAEVLNAEPQTLNPLARRCREAGLDPDSDVGRQLIHLVNELIGFPRHLSQHVGGMVITEGPLCELVPIENAAMDGRTVVEWDKDDLDALGILKVDCLALGMLTAIRKGFDFVEEQESGIRDQGSADRVQGSGFRKENPTSCLLPPASCLLPFPLTLANIPPEDPAVYDMICRADTMGVFQIESRAQMSMLPRLKPRCYYDLVIEVAIVRPGPIQGQMVHPYLRRRAGEEPVTYPNEAIREVLHKTLGVPIFQEQAMRLAVVAAGFTPGEADQLRRAMGAWRRPGVIDQFRKKLIDGMLARGLSQQFAEQVFNQIRGFGEYGFPESHAASFAKLVYVSAWLKHYYPAAFAAALLNSQPMGFYAPAQLVRDAREHGVEVRPVDVNHSRWDCTLENSGESRVESREPEVAESGVPSTEYSPLTTHHAPLRLGFRLISGLPATVAKAIEAARGEGPFQSMDDFVRRTGLSRAMLIRLAKADAFGSLGYDRRTALWEALGQEKLPVPLPLLDFTTHHSPLTTHLPPLPPHEEVYADYKTLGLSLRAHPISFCREELDRLGVTPAARLAEVPHNQSVCVAGLVLLRQRPGTAKGITFVTLEDETGAMNLIVHQQTWDRFYTIARRAGAWLARGRLECKDSVRHVIVSQLEDLSRSLGDLHTKSRDFR